MLKEWLEHLEHPEVDRILYMVGLCGQTDWVLNSLDV